MQFKFWRKQVREGVEKARAERRASEYRLEIAQREVIHPLREMREKNHVSDMLNALIQRRTGEQR
jgi:transcriptional regulator NrdR family protein